MKKLYTHGPGEFHPDDVLAAVVLTTLNPNAEVVRTRDPEVLEAAKSNQEALLFDVGGEFDPWNKVFDHHFKDAPTRENGVPLSSFGLVWRQFGEKFLDRLCLPEGINLRKLADMVDAEIVEGIDAIDCGVVEPRFRPTLENGHEVRVNCLGEALFALNAQPVLGLPETDDLARFMRAVDVARILLDGMIMQIAARLHGQSLIRAGRREEEKIVVVETNVPDWSDVVSAEFEETLFYLDPDSSTPGGWMIWQVPTEPRGFAGRKPLPEEWAGKRDADLEAVTGIEGGVFCHSGRFVGGASSLDAALAMAKAAIKA